MSNYTKALIFATRAHGSQTRNNGNPYIVHPIRVSQEVKTDEQKVIALLHDVVEDTPVTLQEIGEAFGVAVMDAVGCLTRGKDEMYSDYISRIIPNRDAVAVKIADICDNLSDSPSRSAIERSAKAIARLVNSL